MTQIESITSRDNRRLVRVRKIRDGEIEDLIFVEGRRLVREAIDSNLDIIECYISDTFHDPDIFESFKKVAVTHLPDKLFRSIADTDHSQGVVVIAKRPESAGRLFDFSFDSRSTGIPIVIFLKEVNNPSNLGAILRTAEAAGVAGVIVSPRSANPFSPKALRAAMGSSFRLRIWTGVEFGAALEWAREGNSAIVATNPRSGLHHTQFDWTTPTLLVLGSEADGLTPTEIEAADTTVNIQLSDQVESLNLAVSAGIILFEAKRQIG